MLEMFKSFKRRESGGSPPGPRGSPLVGVIPDMLSDPLRCCQDAARNHGDVALLDLGLTQVYLISSAEHALYVLKDHADNFQKGGALWEGPRRLLGNGLMTTDGASWLRQRRMIQPQFGREHLAGLVPLMTQAVEEELGSWGLAAQRGATLDVYEEMAGIASNVLLRSMFGTSAGRAERAAIHENTTVAVEQIGIRILFHFLPEWLPLPGDRRFRSAVETIDRIIYRIIAERRRSGTTGDLLALLLRARDEVTGGSMDERQLRDEVVTLILTGHETTVAALAWTYYLVCRHPEVESKLRAELDTVLAGRAPTVEDLTKLTYLRMVLQESLRLYPSAWASFRTAVADDSISGYRVPAGSVVAILFSAILRHPATWDNPDDFDPERFQPARFGERQRRAYMPFGAGAHQCIGNNFALLEMTLILTALMQRYRSKLVSDRPVEPRAFMTLRPREPIAVTLRPA